MPWNICERACTEVPSDVSDFVLPLRTFRDCRVTGIAITKSPATTNSVGQGAMNAAIASAAPPWSGSSTRSLSAMFMTFSVVVTSLERRERRSPKCLRPW